MGAAQEGVVRALLDSMVAGDPDAAVEHYADDANLHVVAWYEPIVGKSAIRADLDRQAGVYTDLRCEIVNMVSTDSVVFAERVDTVKMGGRDVTMHTTGVFEIQGGKITAWRDYLDMKEIEGQLG